jgi:nucleotide-binding universal stress UspA family protein
MIAQHILVPIDFSPYADEALDYAMTLASVLQARLTLLHVMAPLPLVGMEINGTALATYLDELEAESTQTMEAYRARVTHAGLPCDVAVVLGTPYQVIIDTACARQVDLIVMGTHGRTGLRHLFLGSVAERVVQLAPCAVLVVRVPTQTPAQEPPSEGSARVEVPASPSAG